MFGCRMPGQRCTGAPAALLTAELLSSEWRIAVAQIVSEALIGRDAKLDQVPVLAITGMQETPVLGTGYQQEVNLDKLCADVAGYEQAKKFAEAFLKGQPRKSTIATTLFRGKIEQFKN
jgi:hypothetical protein